MMCYGVCAWLIAIHAVMSELLIQGIGETTIITSSWAFGWGNVLATQVSGST